jgi:hypothetical protein
MAIHLEQSKRVPTHAVSLHEWAFARMREPPYLPKSKIKKSACDSASPLPVSRENIIFCLHFRVAREPALGVVRLRRLVS